MSEKRTRHVMLRLTRDEYARLTAAAPPGEELAAFARRTLLTTIDAHSTADVRRAAAFVVAALSPDLRYEEALALFDEHLGQPDSAHST